MAFAIFELVVGQLAGILPLGRAADALAVLGMDARQPCMRAGSISSPGSMLRMSFHMRE